MGLKAFNKEKEYKRIRKSSNSKIAYIIGLSSFCAFAIMVAFIFSNSFAFKNNKIFELIDSEIYIPEEEKFKYVEAGLTHTYAITEEGDLYAWGSDSVGKLGMNVSSTLIPKKVPGISNVKQISTGTKFNSDIHTLAVTEEGDLYAWGYNSNGELGDGTRTYKSKPVKISGISNVKKAVIGFYCSLAITENGDLYIWGLNYDGRLGLGHTNDAIIPTKMTSLSNIVDISSGYGYYMAVASSGDLYTWGSNVTGQLGIGVSGSQYNIETPKKVNGISNVKSVSAGSYHAAAVTKTGDLYTWGSNSGGQLGDGTGVSKYSPTKIISISNVQNVSASYTHTMAVTSSGDVYSSGANGNGQVGNGTNTKQLTLTKISLPEKIQQISASGGSFGAHSAGVSNAGKIYIWGSNGSGQIGDGATAKKATPTIVEELPNHKKIQAARGSTLLLSDLGDVYVWGSSGSWGQLGLGSITNVLYPTKIPELSNIKDIDANSEHALALTNNGEVFAWGYNANGQIGDGTTTVKSTPYKISELSNIASIATVSYRSAAVSDDGKLYIWGDNANNQISAGTTTNHKVPYLIEALSDMHVKKVILGASYTIVQTIDDELYAWGNNSGGQLGIGTTTSSDIPVKINFNKSIKQIEGDRSHTMILTEDGEVYAWGYNSNGELGDGTTNNVTSPKKISSLSNIKSIAAGNGRSMAIDENGRVYVWGENSGNSSGQLGDGTTVDQKTPKLLNGIENIKYIALTKTSVTDSTGFLISEDNTTYGWGANGSRQLNIQWGHRYIPYNLKIYKPRT